VGALRRPAASTLEVGAGIIVVNVDGVDVVDIWGGRRDAERTTPWTEDTIVTLSSITKTITSLAALMLVDRGQLDPFAPVATYWPDFAATARSGCRSATC
jgi:CubicO group peptidase (beta-lactamase class C family)